MDWHHNWNSCTQQQDTDTQAYNKGIKENKEMNVFPNEQTLTKAGVPNNVFYKLGL